MNHKAQGTIEYLVIIAIVVVIALVVVGLLLQILGNFGGANETALKTSWKTAEPWAIQDWSAKDGTLSIILKNNTAETLEFNSITASSETSETVDAQTIAPGAVTTQIDVTIVCTQGHKYSIPKNDIQIDYNTQSIDNKKQYGVADIAGTC
jgi:ABC-type cobalt transport system substrate-binding protein